MPSLYNKYGHLKGVNTMLLNEIKGFIKVYCQKKVNSKDYEGTTTNINYQ